MEILPKLRIENFIIYKARPMYNLGDYLTIWKDEEGERIEFLVQVVSFTPEYVFKTELNLPSIRTNLDPLTSGDTRSHMTQIIPQKIFKIELSFLAQIKGYGKENDINKIRARGKRHFKLVKEEVIRDYLEIRTRNIIERYDLMPVLPMGILNRPFASQNPYFALQVNLIPFGLKRSIGVFGQSGSGKSYAIGKILEELYFHTPANIVVLDINGDYKKFTAPIEPLNKINAKQEYKITETVYQKYIEIHQNKRSLVKIFSNDDLLDENHIHLNFEDFDEREKSALLDIDPTLNPEIYWTFLKETKQLKESNPQLSLNGVIDHFLKLRPSLPTNYRDSILEPILRRLEYLKSAPPSFLNKNGTREETLITSFLKSDVQIAIIDISTLEPREMAILSSVILRTLWDKQRERKRANIEIPTILIVDEAHNLFPTKPVLKNQDLTLEQGIRIAGEGRKYGLYTILGSQLPTKVHEFVLTQCGSLVLMKMASQANIKAIQDAFSYVRESLLEVCKTFEQGDAMIIGDIVPISPAFIHFVGRVTMEGGKDLKVNWNNITNHNAEASIQSVKYNSRTAGKHNVSIKKRTKRTNKGGKDRNGSY